MGWKTSGARSRPCQATGGRGRGVQQFSVDGCVRHLTIHHAPLPRRSIVRAPTKGTTTTMRALLAIIYKKTNTAGRRGLSILKRNAYENTYAHRHTHLRQLPVSCGPNQAAQAADRLLRAVRDG